MNRNFVGDLAVELVIVMAIQASTIEYELDIISAKIVYIKFEIFLNLVRTSGYSSYQYRVG